MEAIFIEKSWLPFAQDFYGRIQKDYERSNCFVSPLSVFSGLSLALCGSARNSCDELLRTLYLNMDGGVDFDSTIVVLGKALNELLEGDETKTIILANGLFLDSEFEVSQGFKSALFQHFKAHLEVVDFHSAPEKALKRITDWAADLTFKKISALMPQGSVDSSTRLVLANAVYFKGAWARAFKKERMVESPFYTLDGDTVDVPMMSAKASYEISQFTDLKANVIKIPFKIHKMFIVLPEAKDGLPTLFQALFDTSKLERFSSLFDPVHYRSVQIELHLPKFRVCTSRCGSIDLKEPLSQMGLNEVFNPSCANFSRITDKENLYISKIVHQAVIEVDDEGAEAAAGTAVAISNTVLAPLFIVDHPFIFFIVTEAGAPAFMGHVANPLERL